MTGKKFDGGKLRYDLMPTLAFENTVKVLTYGTIKYDDENWKLVPNGRKRYLAAAMRHIQEYRKGNMFDEETETHHLSNAVTDLLFIIEKDLQGWEDVEEDSVLETQDSWIDWSGGATPDAGDLFVDVKFRSGEISERYTADTWYWGHLGYDSDIVAYKVSQD